MLELGSVVFLVAIAYAMGVVWYSLLGRTYSSWMRVAAFPFVGAILGEALVTVGPTYFGLHLYVVIVSTMVAVLTDIAVTWIQQRTPVSRIAQWVAGHATALLGR